jgi:hypothetical protein
MANHDESFNIKLMDVIRQIECRRDVVNSALLMHPNALSCVNDEIREICHRSDTLLFCYDAGFIYCKDIV